MNQLPKGHQVVGLKALTVQTEMFSLHKFIDLEKTVAEEWFSGISNICISA